MTSRTGIRRLLTLGAISAPLLYSILLTSAKSQEKLHAKVIELDSRGKDYLQILGGPPESVTMKSGLVVLEPNKSVGRHSTGQHEELLVILEGQGEMSFRDGSKLELKANRALYCPPETEHDVSNTGRNVLRYVYIVASTR